MIKNKKFYMIKEYIKELENKIKTYFDETLDLTKQSNQRLD